MSQEPPKDPFSGLSEAAASCHELYLSFVGAGFLPDQAMYLVASVLVGAARPGPPAQP